MRLRRLPLNCGLVGRLLRFTRLEVAVRDELFAVGLWSRDIKVFSPQLTLDLARFDSSSLGSRLVSLIGSTAGDGLRTEGARLPGGVGKMRFSEGTGGGCG
jgi:hypothetical protein